MSFDGKIFGIGLSKTGTTSLYEALDLLGYRWATFRHMNERGLTSWFRGEFAPDLLHDFDAVTDLPIGAFYLQLDARYPDARFILTTRAKAEWLESCRRFFGPDRMDLDAHWPFRDHTQLATYGSIGFNEHRFGRTYDVHHEGVREHFRGREGKLLELDILGGQGWETLCPFLGRDVPAADFPHVLPLGKKMVGGTRA